MAQFTPYSVVHAAVLLLVAIGTAAAIWLRPRFGRAVDYVVGGLNLGWWVTASIVPAIIGGFDPSRHLPLHACDISALAAAGAMFFNWRIARATLYYVGIGLSSWALWTPDLADGPATAEFWIFFVGHGATVGGAVYDLVARRFRPNWKDLETIVTIMLVWISIAFAVNAKFGWNYGYVGDTHARTTNPIDFLGPWPWRVLVLTAVSIGLFAAMTWPWTRRLPRLVPSQ